MFETCIFHSKNRPGAYLRYLIRREPGENLPLLIHLHGSGSRGNDPTNMKGGPLTELRKGRELGAVFAAPQCHCDTWFELFDVLLEWIETMIADPAVDSTRVYLAGTSMGAYGAWQVAMSRPEWFAALVPVCGGGMYWNAARLKDVPIWAFHGALDMTVYPEESIKMVAAVNRNQGNAKLTVYPNVAHNAWDYAYADDEMWKWLFAQRKGQC